MDHGTAFDIAGKGIAHYEGMTESIVLAGKFQKQIKAYDLAVANA